MQEVLLLFIGKGKVVSEPSKNYVSTKYFLSNFPNNIVDTPFIGEALLKLFPNRFNKVHIFGTKDALWDFLFDRCTNGDDIENLDNLNEAVKTRALYNGDPLLKLLEKNFSSYIGTQCHCHIVELGTTDEQIWETFKIITSSDLDLDGCRISIDITHSLRFHPLFLVLALNYFQSVNTKTSFGSVFYGAFELTKEHNGLTPILNLTLFTEIMEWVNAAQAFQRYGDPKFLADLLKQYNQPTNLINKMVDFSNALQLNDVKAIEKTSAELNSLLHRLKAKLPAPLQLITPSIQDLPNKLQQSKQWEIMLKVSRYHLNSNHIGLAVLAAWEAIIERFADIYKPTRRQNIKTYSTISRKVRSGVLKEIVSKDFQDSINELSDFRNHIAHAGESEPKRRITITDIAAKFPGILALLEKHLGDIKLMQIKELEPWED
jgi:CRISPR-associated Csx2 family protein